VNTRRLSKRDVETLLRDYDQDPVAALTVALRVVLRLPDAAWEELVDACDLSDDRRRALAARDVDALDRLAMDLNEERGSSV
jgi:hypothetical protein